MVAGSLVPKLVGERKTPSDDDVQSMSAGVFSVLYPALARYMLAVLTEAAASLRVNSSPSIQSTAAQQRVSETAGLGAAASVVVDASEGACVKMENMSSRVGASPLLFPVLSLLCRLSPGLDVTDEGRK